MTSDEPQEGQILWWSGKLVRHFGQYFLSWRLVCGSAASTNIVSREIIDRSERRFPSTGQTSTSPPKLVWQAPQVLKMRSSICPAMSEVPSSGSAERSASTPVFLENGSPSSPGLR